MQYYYDSKSGAQCRNQDIVDDEEDIGGDINMNLNDVDSEKRSDQNDIEVAFMIIVNIRSLLKKCCRIDLY
jgi:hypothetical protein